MNQNNAPAFTLVELLVVVAIIVVLLALLVPAMDKAMYQTELALCGANLKAVAGGANAYAFDFNRSYPYRAGARVYGYRPTKIFRPSEGAAGDLRRVIAPYIPINKMLNDPLSDGVDMENSKPNSWVYVNIALWFGWHWTTPQAKGNMFKVGNRFGYDGHTFDLLAGDDHVSNRQATIFGSHPDDAGVLYNQVWQDEGASLTGETNVVSRWISEVTVLRGGVDQNYAHADGSVTRVQDIRYDNDEDMVWVPLWPYSATNPGDWVTYIPRR